MEVVGRRLRDVPLIVEGLLARTEQVHREYPPAGEADTRPGQARYLLAGDPAEATSSPEWVDGQA